LNGDSHGKPPGGLRRSATSIAVCDIFLFATFSTGYPRNEMWPMSLDLAPERNLAPAIPATRALASAMRPHQWVKNLVLFGGLIFSKSLLNPGLFVSSLQACLLFCFASSAVYLLNDLRDIEKDRQHPKKRNRPLAAGQLSPQLAVAAMCGLALIAVCGGFQLGITFGALVSIYMIQNVAYTFSLKQQPILDVMCIASGLYCEPSPEPSSSEPSRLRGWFCAQ
jgi:hypothetical protein